MTRRSVWYRPEDPKRGDEAIDTVWICTQCDDPVSTGYVGGNLVSATCGRCGKRTWETIKLVKCADLNWRDQTKATLSGNPPAEGLGRALSETYARNPKFYGETFSRRSVWYRPEDPAFWAKLGDTTVQPGESMSPRDAMIQTMNQNFAWIRDVLHGNTIVVALHDGDSWADQQGGGFPYNPAANPAPERAVGMEILLSLAAYYGLGVIFMITLSDYHTFVDAAFGAPQMPPDVPNGPWDYIHSLIDPEAYYGPLQTTGLVSVGLPKEGTLGSYFNDDRVIGWLLSGEWTGVGDPSIIAAHKAFMGQWYPWFKALVHYDPQGKAWDGTYMLNDLSSEDPTARVSAFLGLFPSGSEPQMPGVEWYAMTQPNVAAQYSLANGPADLAALVAQFGGNPVSLFEGGSDLTAQDRIAFYNGVAKAAAKGQVSVMNCWVSDDPSPYALSLFESSTSKIGTRTFQPPNPEGWHWRSGNGDPAKPWTDPSNWSLSKDDYQTDFGVTTLGELTDVGTALANAYAAMEAGEKYLAWLNS